ncbi:Deoxyguanosinetriphosphate triphosphohydrolase [Candidatus Koribacter versatilis Ellin345]|uniref:Deoxyguanosinetriphosphate triphosphohydrolase n=1 Tax=Koribacter versatilis (strain Ellin345) TaxID=204669 RepID=Q1IV70_KORVE|nr:dNTP triphosphohydrolase [Candidatus Koribacter versatilis]ABF39230.1 Deoxyguanosinetriphosphate triphosphohydrolase [Candidatus Koribacter versatilis Ellin345]
MPNGTNPEAVGRFDRRHPSDRPPDNRLPAQRDRDRILFTSAFRRLAGITQVVGSEEGHIFHNRLTHSLEVAQVGRRLAEKFLAADNSLSVRLDADVVEAACLAHDLGHPPFGHVSEVLLDKLSTQQNLPDGFEGNAQSFRIITKLAFRSSNMEGLNLTRATLNAVLKYPWARGNSGKKNRKWGAYEAELVDFKFARQLQNANDDEQALEASIMDWSDDITYSVHDLEDFYRARLVPLHLLVTDAGERQRFYDGARKRLQRDELLPDQAFAELQEAFDKLAITIPLDVEYRATQKQRSALRSFTAGLINRYVSNSTVGVDGKKAFLSVPPGFRKEVKMLKQLTWHYVIENPALATQQYGQKRIVEDLFNIFHEEAKSLNAPHIFPTSDRENIEAIHMSSQSGTEKERSLVRAVVDLLSGMTERHAIEMHRRLTGASLGSALDFIAR